MKTIELSEKEKMVRTLKENFCKNLQALENGVAISPPVAEDGAQPIVSIMMVVPVIV